MKPIEGISDIENALFEELTNHAGLLASMEASFGPATALKAYGQKFLPKHEKPSWLAMGPKKACYNNSTPYAVTRNDIYYAEGYAIEPGIPIPVEHAWLVTSSGKVIDPTWHDMKNHVYYGIAFKQSFVNEWLAQNKNQAGILVNLHLMRRYLRSPDELENAIRNGRADFLTATSR